MRRTIGLRTSLIAIGVMCVAAVVASLFADAPSQVTDLTVLSAALAAGYLLDLRPADRSPLPLGFAVVVVLLRAATVYEFVVVVLVASAVGVGFRDDLVGLSGRSLRLVEYVSAALIAGVVFNLVSNDVRSPSGPVLLLGLAGAALAEISVADLVVFVRRREFAHLRARGADLALVSSGILMAVSYAGISGKGGLGLWGPALFSIPLLAAWYSFELGRRTRTTFHQTVQALGVAPELGGLVPPGHVERVAHLAVAMTRQLGLGERCAADVETAAWLHHLGSVCLDSPKLGESVDPSEVARAGAQMLRASHALSDAGDIIGSEPRRSSAGGEGDDDSRTVLRQVLSVASAFDDLTKGDLSLSAWAVEAVTGDGQVDPRVAAALTEVLLRSRPST